MPMRAEACNFTEEELLHAFQKPEYGFSFQYVRVMMLSIVINEIAFPSSSRIKHRTLTFGGVQGSTYTTVAFLKTSGARPDTKFTKF